jgi:hypothetical protein
MQEPFQSLPVVWFIHEDILGQHVRSYAELHESIPNVIEDWRVHFNACAYVAFPDSYLPVCTTLTPNVGIVKTNEQSFGLTFLICDCSCYTPLLILGILWLFLAIQLISGQLKDMVHHILKKA